MLRDARETLRALANRVSLNETIHIIKEDHEDDRNGAISVRDFIDLALTPGRRNNHYISPPCRMKRALGRWRPRWLPPE
jgi:hypothetical protein